MKFNLDEALGLNEGIEFSVVSRPALEDNIWEILDNCISHSIADEFYMDTGLDPEFDSLDEFTRDELENIVRMLDDKGYNDEQFYLDREAGIDWEPGKYHKFYEGIENKCVKKPETMTTIETDSNSIKTWKLDNVKHMNESAEEDWIYLFPELTEEDKKALEDYDLKFLGRNYFEGEVNEVIAGTRGDLERYAKHYLDYVLHPLYLYEPGTFAGDIVAEEKLEEGKAEIHNELESEYISALKKAEEDGTVTFSVKLSEDDEDPAEFDSFEAAKKFAIEHNIDKVHVSDFAHCWGYYCDGEYDEYDERDIDVNEKLEEAMKVCCICGKEFSGYGNNAEPVKSGECCDECNLEVVIPERIKALRFEELHIDPKSIKESDDEEYVEDEILRDEDASGSDIAKADTFNENLNESEDKNEYIIKYEKYYTERFYETTFKAKSDFAAIIKVDDKCGMGQLKEMQKYPEDFEPEELKALENEDTALDYLLVNNGIGCDDILFFKNLTTGKVLIGEEDEEDSWDDDEDLDEKLIQGKSDATLKKNIATEIKAGKDPKQAYAIEYTIWIEGDLYKDAFDKPFHFTSYEEAQKYIEEHQLQNAEIIGQYEKAEYSDIEEQGEEVPEVELTFDDEPVIEYENENFSEHLELAKSEEEKKSIKAEIKETEKEIDHAEDHNDPDKAIELHTHLDMLQEDSEPVVDYINENIKSNPEEAQAVNLDEVK